jgi:hypothetical protein
VDEEKTDFTKEGCNKIGSEILMCAYSARDLPGYYRRYMRAYFRDALRVLDEAEEEEQKARDKINPE